MGTRGVIARVVDDGFAGRYHHWDSYPTELGKTLYRAWRDVFKGDSAAMLKLLIDEHPVGWSTINGADLTKPAGFRELDTQHPGEPQRFTDAHTAWEAEQGPQCYCHGDRHEDGDWLITSNDREMGNTEWAYAISEARPVMTVYKIVWAAWDGAGTTKYDRPIYVATVHLDADEEPDWEELEQMGHARGQVARAQAEARPAPEGFPSDSDD